LFPLSEPNYRGVVSNDNIDDDFKSNIGSGYGKSLTSPTHRGNNAGYERVRRPNIGNPSHRVHRRITTPNTENGYRTVATTSTRSGLVSEYSTCHRPETSSYRTTFPVSRTTYGHNFRRYTSTTTPVSRITYRYNFRRHTPTTSPVPRTTYRHNVRSYTPSQGEYSTTESIYTPRRVRHRSINYRP
jgi:hypothetical protein